MTKKGKLIYAFAAAILAASIFTAITLTKIYLNSEAIFYAILGGAVLITLLCFIGIILNNEVCVKIGLTAAFFAAVCVFFYFFALKYNLFARFADVESFKTFINKYGAMSAFVYIALQFLQVTIVPLPATVTILAGVALFGVWKTILYSCAGIIVGSMFAFALGKVFGVKLVNWIVGEKAYLKYKSVLHGRDKFMLFIMMLLPLFPDDLLCLMAGLSDLSYGGFFVMMLVVRPITIAFSALVLKGAISIPVSGYGIPIWIALLALIVISVVLSWKYGKKIESKFYTFTERYKTKNRPSKQRRSHAKQFESANIEIAPKTPTETPRGYVDVKSDKNINYKE